LGESIAAKIESVKGTLSHFDNLFLMESFTMTAVKPPPRNGAALIIRRYFLNLVGEKGDYTW
jgi:hypothetical protein